ncbi:VOC family protein [Vulgatibacter sp.]|uniref:VOC family protein n=1 Tax=Vulgatibacter sp. TaxID=1971226 RepID=UPI003567C79A
MNASESRHRDQTSADKTDLKLEVVALPVSDLDRAKAFYEGLGWRLDADFSKGRARVIQLTPPGSEVSVHLGTDVTTAAPGSAQSLFLVVSDIEAARAELVERGVEVSEVFHYSSPPGPFGDKFRGPAPEHLSYGSYASFRDPDGNGWILQEVTTRLPGRVDRAATSFASAHGSWRTVPWLVFDSPSSTADPFSMRVTVETMLGVTHRRPRHAPDYTAVFYWTFRGKVKVGPHSD